MIIKIQNNASKIAVSLLVLFAFFAFLPHYAIACSPVPGFKVQTMKGEGFLIKTSSLGPVYTNLNEYTLVSQGFDSCNRSVYAKKSTLLLISALVIMSIIGLIVLIRAFIRRSINADKAVS